MHFCVQELLVLLALVDNLPIVIYWLLNLREKFHACSVDTRCTISC